MMESYLVLGAISAAAYVTEQLVRGVPAQVLGLSQYIEYAHDTRIDCQSRRVGIYHRLVSPRKQPPAEGLDTESPERLVSEIRLGGGVQTVGHVLPACASQIHHRGIGGSKTLELALKLHFAPEIDIPCLVFIFF